ncbi:TPA: TraR/DksA family transcriptional regulator [Salmonella enterica subsp. enterica serovar 4,5,12:b:-]
MTSEIIDQASALEEMMRDHAIQDHRLNHSAVSATHCVECDEQISDARRKAYPGCTMSSSARAIWNCVRRLVGCDVAYMQTLRSYVLERVVYQMRQAGVM